MNVFNNIRSNFLNRIWMGVIGLVAIPFLFKNIGVEQFGMFGMFSILILFFAIADLGLSKSVVRFVTLYKDTKKISQIYSSFAVLFIFFSFILLMLGMFFGEELLALLKINYYEYKTVYFVCLFTVCLMILRSFFIGIIYSYSEFVLYNTINVILETLKWVSMIISSFYENPLENIFIAQLVIMLIHTLVLVFYSIRLIIPSSLKFSFRKDTAKEILSFSTQISIGDFFTKIMSYSDKIVVIIIGTVTNLSYYYLAFQIASKLFEIPGNILLVYYSKFGVSFANKEMEMLRNDYINATRITVILITPLVFSVMFISDLIVELWLNAEVAIIVSPILKVFCVGVFFGSVLLPSISLSNAIGKPKYPLINNAISSIFLIFFSIILFEEYGVLGGASAWSIVQLFPLYFVSRRICLSMNYDFRKYILENIISPSLIILLVFILSYMVLIVGLNSNILFLLISNAISMLTVYFLILKEPEKIWLRRVIGYA